MNKTTTGPRMSPTKDEIEIVRMAEVTLDDEQVKERLKSLPIAMGRFALEIGDEGAELLMSPLTSLEAAAMSDHAGCVSGYIPLRIRQIYGKSESEVNKMVAQAICEDGLEDLEWEVVWFIAKLLIVYGKGHLVQQA